MEYPAISLWQPWASLIAVGAKPYETRDWSPAPRLIGSRIAIHAAKRSCVVDFPQDVADEITKAFGFCNWNHRLPRGAIVATAVLAGAYQCGQIPDGGRLPSIVVGLGPMFDCLEADSFGDFSPGRWAWRLTDVQLLDPPVPERGRQRWWTWRAAV